MHHLIRVILLKEAKNVDFMDGSSDSIHNLDDEKDTSCKLTTLKSIEKVLLKCWMPMLVKLWKNQRKFQTKVRVHNFKKTKTRIK